MMVIKNHRGRDMFFMCFRPPSADAPAVDIVERPVKLVLSSSDDESGRRRKKSGRRSLTGVFKGVFFQTSLTKKFGSKSCRQNSFRSSSNLSSKTEKVINSMKKTASYKEFSVPEEILSTNSNRSSLFSPSSSSTVTSSSSSCASITCNSRLASEIKPSSSLDLKQSNTNKKSKKRDVNNCWNSSPTIGMCTIVACLVALIFWGKVVAILICTTTWLFFVPGRIPHLDSPVNDVDSDEYKKRVIMEGLLKRSNRPRVV
ncbi:Uncharacterized protein Adt_36893 [Abeliophyllum distichum]|uniref:Uncharacterized protein n=1 Tax=Abeliophyllum distichum TaxID=126358 RepID=A0ABD1QIW1_9LAMI